MENTKKYLYYGGFFFLLLYAIYLIGFVYAPDFTSEVKILRAGIIAGTLSVLYYAIKLYGINLKTANKSLFGGDYLPCFIKRYSILSSLISVFASLIIYLLLTKVYGICFFIGYFSVLILSFFSFYISKKSDINSDLKENNPIEQFSYSSMLSVVYLGLLSFILSLCFMFFKDPKALFFLLFGAIFEGVFLFVSGCVYFKSIELLSNSVDFFDNKESIALKQNISSVFDLTVSNISLFLSLFAVIFSSVMTGSEILDLMGSIIPLTLLAFLVLSLILSFVLNPINPSKNQKLSIVFIGISSVILFLAFSYYLIKIVFLKGFFGIFENILIGVILALLIFAINYFCFKKSSKKESITPNYYNPYILSSIFKGTKISFLSSVLIAVFCIFSFLIIGGYNNFWAGVYGISLLAVGELAFYGITVFLNTYFNLCGEKFAKKSFLPYKTYSISIGLIGSILLFICFIKFINQGEIDILNPFGMFFALIGAALPYASLAFLFRTSNVAYDKISSYKKGKSDLSKILKSNCLFSLSSSALFLILSLSVPFVVVLLFFRYVDKINALNSLCAMNLGFIISGYLLSFMLTNFKQSLILNKNEINKDIKHFCDISRPIIDISIKVFIMASFMSAIILQYSV